MSEHTFLAAMLGFVAPLTVIGLYMGYRVHQTSQHLDGITAATFLEVRKVLSQHRS